MISGALALRRSAPASTRNSAIVQLPSAYVHPGQLLVSDAPGVLTTILGSCVAVCLNDPAARIGGMNHYLLPGSSVATEPATRYGVAAIRALYDEMVRRGAHPARMNAQIFGGAAVLAAFNADTNHLGARNVTLARTMLADYGVRVLGENVLGERGRRLVFSPRDGVSQVQVIGDGAAR